MITFEKCQNRNDCKSDAEINEYLKGKYMVFGHAERQFNPQSYNETKFTK